MSELSGIQKFFIRILPRSWAQDMEAHSRSWMVRCANCGYERSIWDIGGIRWRATGRSLTAMRCPNCGVLGKHTVYRQHEETQP